jgi:hypothetical protein
MVPEGSQLLCMNCCPYIVADANTHGTPDPLYVANNLRALDTPMFNQATWEWEYGIEVLLVCGNIAKETFKRSPYKTYGRILFVAHPAWRAWTNEALGAIRDQIAGHTQNQEA